VQRQVGAAQAKRFRVRHQIVLVGKRQRFEIVDIADRRHIDTRLRPALPIIFVTARAERNLAGEQLALYAPYFGKRLPQQVDHRRSALSVLVHHRRKSSAAAGCRESHRALSGGKVGDVHRPAAFAGATSDLHADALPRHRQNFSIAAPSTAR
jgi:hypothetical protein